MFLDRNGYLEETFFTFSFSPIRTRPAGLVVCFNPVTETTAKMLAERRTRALRDLAAQAGKARAKRGCVDAWPRRTLSEFEFDVPFAAVLPARFGRDERTTHCANRLAAGRHCNFCDRSRSAAACVWPLLEVVRTNQAVQVDNLTVLCGGSSCGPYPEPPKTALALPITPPGQRATGRGAGGRVSTRLPLNEAVFAPSTIWSPLL